MGFHTYDIENADALEDFARYRYLSVEELLSLFNPSGTVADLGSGTGFYTDDVAPYAETLYAVDVQDEMHERYREKGVPENVECVTAEVSDLPFDDASLNCAFSTMTYHEFASDAALEELARVVEPDGVIGIADWTSNGTGEDGPPTNERYALADARTALTDAGFEIEYADERHETFVLRARRL
ncbi:class I SAM-dependent methyltransferase [Halocatena marina]|uniref:class I SAM-dependent methyltransferase n=1 Tax=Halocatena marina TaxID=2934937 RepID=UPI00200F9A40|nr:class I SAM-dependent methyltransferase [Halocatena marina]